MAIKFLHDLDVSGNIDLNDNQALNMVLQQLTTNPGTVVEGKIFQNTTSDKVYVGLDGSWVELSSAIGDITSVVGGTNINVSGGDTGDATVNLDTSVTDAIALNTAKTGITSGQASAITANTAKTGISSGQASAITANTNKTGITSSQASAITANTAKTGITSGQASAITANTAKDTFPGFGTSNSTALAGDTTVISSSQASAITANTAKTGITGGQASAITANTAKETDVNHNVSTDLSVTATDSSLTVESSDGDNASIPAATTSDWGAMTDAHVTALNANTAKVGTTSTERTRIAANHAKVGITSDQASAITANTAKTGITSGQASAITANTAKTGISSAQAQAIEDNTSKATDVNHNVTTNLSITGTSAARVIVSSDGDDATIPVATTTVSGVMSAAQVTTLNGKAPKASPTFTGVPAAPTAGAATNTTQIATTAFVKTAVSNLIGDAPGALDTLNELAAAIGDDASYASGVTTAIGLKANTASPTFTGTVGGITKAMVGLGNVANIAVSGSNTGDEVAASTTTAGVVERATDTEALAGADTSRYVTPKHLANRTYTAEIGGATSVSITHGLGTRAVMVQMFDTSSFETVYAQVVRTSATVVTVGFNSAPSSNGVTIMISKIQ